MRRSRLLQPTGGSPVSRPERCREGGGGAGQVRAPAGWLGSPRLAAPTVEVQDPGDPAAVRQQGRPAAGLF